MSASCNHDHSFVDLDCGFTLGHSYIHNHGFDPVLDCGHGEYLSLGMVAEGDPSLHVQRRPGMHFKWRHTRCIV